jgi:hypothetical protein
MVSVRFGKSPIVLNVGENTGEARRARAAAETAASSAAASAAVAEAAVGPTYASTAAGLAATTSGQNFAVDNGNSTVTIYRNNAGSAVAQRTLATVAYFSGTAGASRVGVAGGGTVESELVARPKSTDLSGTGGAALIGKADGGTVQDHLTAWGTRTVGAAPAGTSTPAQVYPTFSAHSGGTTDFRATLFGAMLTGGSDCSLVALMNGQSEARHTSSTLTFQYGITGFNRLGRLGSTTGNITTSRGVEWHIANEGSGTIGVAFDFYAQDVDLLDGSGTIGTMVGFKCGNQGHASRVTTAAIGFDCGNMTQGAPLTVAYRSEMTSGTGKWAFLGAGSAPSSFAGPVRIGDNTVPTRTFEMFQSDVWQRFVNASRSWIVGLGSSSDFQVYDDTGSTTRLRIASSDGSLRPGADNTQTNGAAGVRWSQLHAATNVIATSDEREKTFRADGALTVAELTAARRIIDELGFYQWNYAIDSKGVDGARWHFGPRAQAVARILVEEGLEEPFDSDVPGDVYLEEPPSFRTAFICFDTWPAEYEDEYETVEVENTVPVVRQSKSILNADGTPFETIGEQTELALEQRATGTQRLVLAAGNRFGLRVEQLSLFLIAAQEQRLAALEAAL